MLIGSIVNVAAILAGSTVGQLNRMNPARAECERLDAKEQRRNETCGDAQV